MLFSIEKSSIERANLGVRQAYASKSVAMFPDATNECTLGVSLGRLGEYARAYEAFNSGLKYQRTYCLYNNLAALTQYYGSASSDHSLLVQATQYFPDDFTIWYNLAVFDYRHNNYQEAKVAIRKAANLGKVPSSAFNTIIQS
jgi:tetratricopeptide (TPR) repeat protein